MMQVIDAAFFRELAARPDGFEKIERMFAGQAEARDRADGIAISATVGAAALRDQLVECAEQFRYYERQHRDKGTPDADVKADVNAALADKIGRLIAPASLVESVEGLPS